VKYDLFIRPAAYADIDDAAEWYEERQPGLGIEFARTVIEAIDGLATNPLIHRLRDRRRKVRWFLPPRFPYRICYRVDSNLITVFAILHSARHDRHWKKRL
jgi:plasmid stabilization system protein ParE